VTFTIPAGMPLSGVLTASSSEEGDSSSADGQDSPTEPTPSDEATPGPISNWIGTVADAVDFLNAAQAQDAVKLTYVPNTSSQATATAGVSVNVATPWQLSGIAAISSPVISTHFSSTTVDYRGVVDVQGTVDGSGDRLDRRDLRPERRRRRVGAWKHVATVIAVYDPSQEERPSRRWSGTCPRLPEYDSTSTAATGGCPPMSHERSRCVRAPT